MKRSNGIQLPDHFPRIEPCQFQAVNHPTAVCPLHGRQWLVEEQVETRGGQKLRYTLCTFDPSTAAWEDTEIVRHTEETG